MPNNHAFTTSFASGLREQRDPDGAWKRRMQRLIQRRGRIANSMPHIRMHVSPWVLDPADGCMTRSIWQIERHRIRPAVAQDSISEDGKGVTAEQIKNEPVGV